MRDIVATPHAPMLTVHHSNDLETLADLLAAHMHAEPLSALATETIVVPAIPTGRWLSIAMADRLGISANTRFVLPVAYAWELIGRVLPEVPERSPLSAEPLFWRIAGHLKRTPDGSAFDAVRYYLQGPDAARRFELARELAHVYERYATYRPNWLEAWLNGVDQKLGANETWQAMLFRALAAEMPELPHGHPKERFFSMLERDAALRERLPGRLSIFGVTTLPPLYLEFFDRLGAFMPVTLYLPNPCREYWGQIVRGRTIGRIALERPEHLTYFDFGNRLFGSLAEHGRAFFNAVVEREQAGGQAFVEPDPTRILGRIQRDILDLVEPSEEDDGFELTRTDDSIRIDVCHGAMREADVLHDRLLGLFAKDPTLRSEDVLVLTPDLERYGSAIEAVFSAAPSRRFIPYSIADRSALGAKQVVRTFLRLIDVASDRLEAEAIAGLLDTALIRISFAIEASEVVLLRDWIRRLGIRWGQDGEGKAALGLPTERSTTWQAGLDRLILGAALGGGDEPAELFGDVVPFDDIEGVGTELAGRFAVFARRLFAFSDALEKPRPVAAWRDVMIAAIDDFLATMADAEQDAIALRRLVIALARSAEEARFDEPMSFGSLRTVLEQAIDRESHGARSHSGGVTVADLATGRAVPARVVCLVGMNDELFPRRNSARDFDLMALHPAAGDPRHRDEDRYAFLMALMTAREHLLISYTGRDARNDTERPPSVVVTELLDAVRRCTRSAQGGDSAALLVALHPLQPFSGRYGTPSGPVTYSDAWHPLEFRSPEPFRDGTLSRALVDGRSFTLDELTRFWVNPAASFLRERLGLFLASGDEQLSEHEPFGLKQLDAFQARHALVEAALHPGQSGASVRARMQADGVIPAGEFGGLLLEQARRQLDPLVSTVTAWSSAEQKKIPFSIDVSGWRLTGTMNFAVGAGRLEWRAGRIRASDRMRAWIRHLVWCVLCDDATTTSIVGWEAKKLDHETLARLDQRSARDALSHLFEWVATGLCRPLSFFPESSFAYARSMHADHDPLRALEKARTAWYGAEHDRGMPESADPYFALAMRDWAVPLDTEFVELALRVMNPVLESLEA
ncbi:MAG: exodeoxyribonuclease V subunit gamma [Burkholderiales bacterium]